jgi:hypothetical protein
MRSPTVLLHCLLFLSLGACGEEKEPEDTGCEEGTHLEGDACVPDDTGPEDSGDTDAMVCEDLDGDGWETCDGDCDDGDPAVNPGATEVCNGKDDDCDSYIDNHAADGFDWYPDADGDGYGDAAGKVINNCSGPSTHVADSSDCDDGDPLVNPGETEIWYDGVDSDCDGADDYDQDADGYRSAEHGGDDCDDSTRAASPAGTEVCDDGLDNDCDGTNNGCGLEGTMSVTEAQATLQGAAAGDYAGAAVAAAGDVDGDGYGDLLIGAPRADSGGSNAGDAYLLFGPVSGTSSLSSAVQLVGAATGDLAGTALAGLGDQDGDGYDDIAVGAYGNDNGGSGAGAVYVLEGPVSSGGLGSAQAKIFGANASDALGYAIAALGDATGDGLPDLLVGAYGADSSGADSGSAYLFAAPLAGQLSPGSAAAVFSGAASGDAAGWAVHSAGDVDGDSLVDIIVGAPNDDDGGTDAGAVAIFTGGPSGSVGFASATALLSGVADNDHAGYAVAGAGDVDGDGYGDVVVGAPDADPSISGGGAAYIVLGPVTGTLSLGSADVIVMGDSASGRLGLAVTGAADIDADGRADVMVGADRHGGGLGAGFVVLGGASGSFDASSADAILEGETYQDWAGSSVALIPDTNGDGRDDILIGAWGNDGSGADAGAAYLFEGHGI